MDLIVVPPEGTTGMSANKSSFERIKELATADKGDGIQFEVERIGNPVITRIFPHLLHTHAVAKSDGNELMRFEVDVRLAPGTVLPPITKALESPLADSSMPTVTSFMQPEEGFEQLMAGQTPAQLEENVAIVRNFYDRIQPQLANSELLPGTPTNPFARMKRFAQRQVLVFPGE